MSHKLYMAMALAAARRAADRGEVPIGAVVVRDKRVLAVAANQREADNDPSAHAEMLAVRIAARRWGDWRLYGSRVYVTLEPCPMCAGVLLQARVKTVIFGAKDPKGGALGSLVDLSRLSGYNHHLEVVGGVLADQCSQLLIDFFKKLR